MQPNPEVLLRHRGVTVYRTYKDRRPFPQQYIFTLSPLCDDETCGCGGPPSKCRNVFDVRDLLLWSPIPEMDLAIAADIDPRLAPSTTLAARLIEEAHACTVIVHSIDCGLLPPMRPDAPRN